LRPARGDAVRDPLLFGRRLGNGEADEGAVYYVFAVRGVMRLDCDVRVGRNELGGPIRTVVVGLNTRDVTEEPPTAAGPGTRPAGHAARPRAWRRRLLPFVLHGHAVLVAR